jgi:nucleoside-diphosphate-sugar epimerase
MSVYKSFAVVGGGKLGLPILNALAAKGVSVILLSRPGSATKTVPSGVPVVEVDSSDAAAVAAVFKEHKIDVVLATLGAAATAAQKPLVDAAKLAGVKLFVPSEYGFATDGSAETESILTNKDKIAGDSA